MKFHYVLLPGLLIAGAMTLGCKSKTETVNVPSNWNGVCGSSGQTGAPVTLRFNTAISSITDPIFTGSCGALGASCEFNGNAAPTDLVVGDEYPGSEIEIVLFTNPDCDTDVNGGGFGFLPSSATVESLGFTCPDGGSVGISVIPYNNEFAVTTPIITLTSSATSPLISCSVPLADFGGATQVCFNCPV